MDNAACNIKDQIPRAYPSAHCPGTTRNLALYLSKTACPTYLRSYTCFGVASVNTTLIYLL